MKSAVAILTFNRRPVLAEMLRGMAEHCPGVPTAVFEDAGRGDDTVQYLRALSTGEGSPRQDLLATQIPLGANRWAFVGDLNLGVAGNSNRALKWLMEETDAEHFCLCNDDLHVLGDFPRFYSQAHQDLGVGLFCFNDFWEWPTHRWALVRSRGYRVRVFQRMTGIMLSVLRGGVEKAGYFDVRFGKFGEEHCDWTNRLRFCGQIKLDGIDQMNLDVEPTLPDGTEGPPVLRHQNAATSLSGEARKREDELAVQRMQEAVQRYQHEPHYRPFALVHAAYAGGTLAQGICVDEIPGYRSVVHAETYRGS